MIERYKSGFEPPEPVPFEDLSDWRPPDPQLGQLPPPPAGSPKPNTVKGTLSARKFGKRGGIFGIFGGSKVSQRGRVLGIEDRVGGVSVGKLLEVLKSWNYSCPFVDPETIHHAPG